MSGDINIFVVDGFVGADPQINIASDDKATRARMRIATTRKFQKDNGDTVEYTEWFSVVFWGSALVENVIAPFVKKGSFVQVMGRVQNTRWTDQNGVERFGIEIVAARLDLLDRADAPQHDFGNGTIPNDPAPESQIGVEEEIPF